MTSPRETTRLASPGQVAPDFDLAAHPEHRVRLSDFKGKANVVLAFYPKDDTPGCTRELCAFTRDKDSFQALDTIILGISCDTLESHREFADSSRLSVTLLSDPEGLAGQAYGAVLAGHHMASRVLFVIDKQGIVRHVVEGMPDNNELLALISNLGT